MTVHHGDCRAILATFADASIDAIVTDPPYELGFMGKHWDASGIAYDPVLWSECLRVLKPGGHLLAFGGTRTYHRMAVAIEDAGFEVRDSIHWLYGSGFPKSLDVSKAIDKRGGNVAGFEQFRDAVKDAMKRNGVSRAALTEALGNHMLSHYLTAGSQPAVPNTDDYRIIRDTVGLGSTWDECFLPKAEREVMGTKKAVPGVAFTSDGPTELDITAPATDAARQWEGWGTALKPAHEPIVVARKPLIGTVAANVLQYGTGAINVDGARVACTDKTAFPGAGYGRHDTDAAYQFAGDPNFRTTGVDKNPTGRWPANIVFTHAADCGDQCAEGCPVAALDEQSGVSRDGVAVRHRSGGKTFGSDAAKAPAADMGYGGEGGASRFFTVTEWDVPFRYIAKPSKRERNAGLDELPIVVAGSMAGGVETRPNKGDTRTPRQNHHPTVKPLALMRWLVRLVTPPGGIVLDPFLGSGTTAAAAVLEGFDWVGCEMTAEYLPIIEGRVAWAHEQAGKPAEAHRSDEVLPFGQLDLFGGEAA